MTAKKKFSFDFGKWILAKENGDFGRETFGPFFPDPKRHRQKKLKGKITDFQIEM